MVTTSRVGVLSLQGDFARHRDAIEALGVEARRVTLPRDLEDVAALLIPGGESTTLLRLIAATGLREPLERFVRERPVLGTCAGVIVPLPALIVPSHCALALLIGMCSSFRGGRRFYRRCARASRHAEHELERGGSIGRRPALAILSFAEVADEDGREDRSHEPMRARDA